MTSVSRAVAARAISARALGVGELLSPGRRLSIPDYQRPYVWSTEHAEALLDDIVGAMAMPDYFLGSIVLLRGESGASSEIVDGQQRLITLTLLLALIRDDATTSEAMKARLADAIGDAEASPKIRPRTADAEILSLYAQQPGATRRAPTAWRPLVESEAGQQGPSLEDEDTDSFVEATDTAGTDTASEPIDPGLVDQEVNGTRPAGEAAVAPLSPTLDDLQLPDSQRRILENRDHLKARLAKRLGGESPLELDRLGSFILDRCLLVVTEVDGRERAHRVFAVLNTRGEPLAETDILKAEVLGAIGDTKVRQACHVIWEDCEADLGREELQRLFGHIRMIALRRRARRAIVDEIREHLAPLERPVEFVENVLQPYAQILAQINAGDLRLAESDPVTAQEVRRYLAYLNWLPNASWKPALMAFVMRHGDDPRLVRRFLRQLDRLAYGLLILKQDEGERVAKFRDVLEAIEAGRSLFSQASSPMRLDRRSRRVIVGRLSNNYFGMQGFASVVLRRIDADHVRGPLPDYARATIEHVLPRNPGGKSQWLRWYPGTAEDPWKGVVETCDRLGNLILLSSEDNHAAANNGPDKKWAIYFSPDSTSPFALKRQLGGLKSWTRKSLDAIHERRIARMVHVWGLQTEPATAEAKVEAAAPAAASDR